MPGKVIQSQRHGSISFSSERIRPGIPFNSSVEMAPRSMYSNSMYSMHQVPASLQILVRGKVSFVIAVTSLLLLLGLMAKIKV